MDNFIQALPVYLGQVSLILISLTIIYILISKKLTFYKLNRLALMSIVLSSILIPLLQFNVEVSKDNQLATYIVPTQEAIQFSEPITDIVSESTDSGQALPPQVYDTEYSNKLDFTINWYVIFVVIYLIGFIAFLILFLKNLIKVIQLKINGQGKNLDHYKLLICDTQQPFSFFNLIFVSEEHLERSDIDIILKHESTHGYHFHSIDAIVFELLKAFIWFNPIVYYLSRQSRLNNEFFTDQLVTKNEGLEVYSNALLNLGKYNSPAHHQMTIVNSFALLSLKPRVMQLVKKPSDRKWKYSYLSFVPVLTIFLLVFSCNLNEEVGKTGIIKSIKGTYYDEYGDQSERNGSVLVDLNFDINNNLTSDRIYRGSISKGLFNDLQYKLGFVQWGEEVNILKFGVDWNRISDGIDEETANQRLMLWKLNNPDGSASISKKQVAGTSAYVVSFSKGDNKFSSSDGLNRSFEYDEAGRISISYTTVYSTEDVIGDRIKAVRSSIKEAAENGNSYLEKQLEASLARFEAFRGNSRMKIGDFAYDDQGRLVEYSPNWITMIDQRKKVFTYDENDKLTNITEYKKPGRKTCSYSLIYNEKGEFDKVLAYNGKDKLEYTVEYTYEFY